MRVNKQNAKTSGVARGESDTNAKSDSRKGHGASTCTSAGPPTSDPRYQNGSKEKGKGR